MAVNSFIPEIWAARLLYNLEKIHVAAAFCNRDYEGDITDMGDTVHINKLGPITVRNYVKNTDMNPADDLATTDDTLLIDQAKYFNFQIDDVDAAQVAGDLMDSAMQRAAYSLNDEADSYIFSELANNGASANYVGTAAAPIALTAANIYEQLVKLRLALDKANVPTLGRKVVVPPEVYAVLLQSNQFLSSTVKDDAIVNGFVGRIAGFDVYESNNAVHDSTNNCWVISACVPEAITYAEQIVKTEAYRPEKRFADAVKGLHVYGAKVTRPEAVATLFATV